MYEYHYSIAFMILRGSDRIWNLCFICKAAFARQRFFMMTVTLVFIFTKEMQRLHEVILLAEVNYTRGMWACHFWQVLEVQHDAL